MLKSPNLTKGPQTSWANNQPYNREQCRIAAKWDSPFTIRTTWADFLPQNVGGLQKCKNDEKYKLTSTAMEFRARTKNEKTLYMINNIFFIQVCGNLS